jgi:eukaryotic-like serine/threonine-protein kinase
MDPSSPYCPIAPGVVVAGKYRVERTIGIGGMGVVVAARHLALDDRVAIKFLLPHALANTEAVNRFAREARAAVRIKSQHVARTLDVGRLDDGAPYIVMEYLDGVDLATRLRTQGPLAVDCAVGFILQVCEALANAHVLGIIHRDLKPANLFVTRTSDGSECIKVLDFGISKLTDAGSGQAGLVVTNTSAMMGSPMYMAPEQMISARTVDARSDIWSLGVTLFELLSAERPFVGENIAQLCASVTGGPCPSVRQRRPDVPAALEVVINRCLEKARESRYANVAELAWALKDFAPRHAWVSIERTARVLVAAGGPTEGIESCLPTERETEATTNLDPTVAPIGGTKRPPQRRSRLLAIVAVSVVATVGVGTLLYSKGSGVAPAGSALGTVAVDKPASSVLAVASLGVSPPEVVPALVPAAAITSSLTSEPVANSTTGHRVPGRPSSSTRSNKSLANATERVSPPAASANRPNPNDTNELPDLGGVGREY